jgi:hypothetical protein
MNIEQNLLFKTWHFILSSLKNSFAFHFITINLIAANYGNSMFAERERERERERVLGFFV